MHRGTLLGPILLLVGVYLLLRGDFHIGTGSIFTYFWPTLFVLPLGVFFHWLYFSVLGRRGVGVLVPGGVLLTVFGVCQIAMLLNNWGMMWPGFILAPAVGLFELYWFGGRNKWLLIPINILSFLSLLFFAIFSIGYMLGKLTGGSSFIAILLIGAGALVMLSRRRETI
ncbi:hypothetical protein [Cohnella sp. 56]|uniref:hypothetical protein n=1 Tax=Cohnella sp. 56 TaxID=3113722 RepID=UPI0030E7D8C2